MTDESPWNFAKNDGSVATALSRPVDDNTTLTSARSQLLEAQKKLDKTRKTSKQAQEDRKATQRGREKKALVFKFATAWFQAVKNLEIDFLTTPNDIAKFFNNAFGLEGPNNTISAGLIKRAHENGTSDQKLPLNTPNS